jgi:hypothetical protein
MTMHVQAGAVIRATYLAQDAAFSDALFDLYGGHPQWPNVMQPDGSVLPVTPPLDDDDDAPPVEEPLPPVMAPMTAGSELLHEIRAYLEKWDMSPATFGARAVGYHALVRRLEGGASVKAKTIADVRAFMSKPPTGSWRRVSSTPKVVTQKQADPSFDVRSMVREVAKHFGEKPEVVASTARQSKHHVVLPKQVLAWRLVRERKWSAPRVGMLMGRDHGTILYAVRKVEQLIAADQLRLPAGWGSVPLMVAA